MFELKAGIENLLQPSKLIVVLYIINFLIAFAIVFLERKDRQYANYHAVGRVHSCYTRKDAKSYHF